MTALWGSMSTANLMGERRQQGAARKGSPPYFGSKGHLLSPSSANSRVFLAFDPAFFFAAKPVVIPYLPSFSPWLLLRWSLRRLSHPPSHLEAPIVLFLVAQLDGDGEGAVSASDCCPG